MTSIHLKVTATVCIGAALFGIGIDLNSATIGLLGVAFTTSALGYMK